MSLRNPLLSGTTPKSNQLLLSASASLQLTSPSQHQSGLLNTTASSYISNLLATKNTALSESLFGRSILHKSGTVYNNATSLTIERNDARLAKLKNEALELKSRLVGESAYLGLRSELLLTGTGGGSGYTKGSTAANLANPHLENRLLSSTLTSSNHCVISKITEHPTTQQSLLTSKSAHSTFKAEYKPRVVNRIARQPNVEKSPKARSTAIKTRSASTRNEVAEVDVTVATQMPDYCLEDWNPKPNKRITFDNKTKCVLEHDLDIPKPLFDIQSIKRALINGVAGSLIRVPNFKEYLDPVRQDLISIAVKTASYEPEFVLKVALYTRNELNIRTTANFLLAFAAYNAECRPFLRRYFNTSIRLPSDWIDVAEQYQVFDDQSITFGALPAALRRVMIVKFADFDKHQLGKYNKDSSKSKKKKDKLVKPFGNIPGISTRGGRGGGRGRGRSKFTRSQSDPDNYNVNFPSLNTEEVSEPSELSEPSEPSEPKTPSVEGDSDTDDEEELVRKTFTLKQLIRKMHITEPVENVMCLIGKKYPLTPEEFYQSRLPAVFEEERAGKRMKLPTPETWETQVSLKGNKASTWQDLIDHKKLPFMAMLRNIRNMIKAGISEKHHNWVIRKLTDRHAVANSRQFPFRFFSAYEVLTQLENDFNKNQEDLVENAVAKTSAVAGGFGGRGRGGRGGRGGTRGGRGGKGKRGDKAPEEVKYDSQLITRYRKALDTAVKLATTHNVTPIPGNTVIFVNIGDEMNIPCSTAKGLGKPRQLVDVGVLLGLMCKYSCEECCMQVYGSNNNDENSSTYTVDLEKGTILDNMESVKKLQPLVSCFGSPSVVPQNKLNALLRDRIQVDNMIILSMDMDEFSDENQRISSFLDKYRRTVNPALLFVNVDLGGRVPGISTSLRHENDVYIAGFSDQILRFVAERGAAGQLVHVDKIDEAYNLKPLPIALTNKSETNKHQKLSPDPEKPLALPRLTPRWRTARVFISSTFRDMHGERDLLTRFVFPELRARAERHLINVYEVDLRWGVTEQQTRNSLALQLCLSEVERSDLFVGLLGERYGWVPDCSTLPDEPEFDWVPSYPPGASVTELEMYLGGLRCPEHYQGQAFFYFRNNAFTNNVPNKWRDAFVSEDSVSGKKMNDLKGRIRRSGLEVMDGYPCVWGGVVDNIKPIVAGLDVFGMRVINNLWTALTTLYPDEDALLDEDAHVTSLHEAFMESRREKFIGREKLVKTALTLINTSASRLVMFTGKSGTGKTAVVCEVVQQYIQNAGAGAGAGVLTHMLGAAPGSTHLGVMLRRLCHEMKRRFALRMGVPDEFKNLIGVFREMLIESASRTSGRFLLVLDGLDLLQSVHQAHNLEWLPETLPENCVLIVSATEGSAVHESLLRRKPESLLIGPLGLLEKAPVVRHTLALHRKTLDESVFNNQMKLLTSKRDGANPLYLSLACDVLRNFGVFEKLTERIKLLPPTVPMLLKGVLEMLEVDHGNDMVSTALSLLVCARNGVHESTLLRLVSISCQLPGNNKYTVEDVIHAAFMLKSTDVVPAVTFARLVRGIRSLAPAVEDQCDTLSVDNAHVKEAIKRRYLTQPNTITALHTLLAGYYRSCADVENDCAWQGTNIAAFADLPYHLAQAGCLSDLEEVMCDLHFLHTKCQLGMTAAILEDFYVHDDVSKRTVTNKKCDVMSPRWEAYRSFMLRNAHILESTPSLLWQQALNEPGDGPVHLASEAWLRDRQQGHIRPDRPEGLLQWVNRPQRTQPCTLTLTGLPEVVTSVAFSPNDQMFVCGAADGTARVYMTETGRETLLLTGHSNKVTGVTFVGDSRVCTASADGTLCLWDSKDGHRLNVMKGHKRQVSSVTTDPAGKVIVSTGWDCHVKIWDTNTGQLVNGELKPETRPSGCVAFHPQDEVIATGWWDATIRLYNIFHKTRLGILRGHSTSVRDVAYNPTGRHIASASLDGEVKLWSSAQGTLVGNLHCHSLPINQLRFAPSGHELVTVSDDRQIKVWSGHLGRPLGQLASTTMPSDGPVSTLVLCSAGDQAIVGYHKGLVRMFDTRSGVTEWQTFAHTGRVRCIALHEKYLLTGSDDPTTAVLAMATGVVVTYLTGHAGPVLSVASCSYMVITTSTDGSVCVYNMVDAMTLEKEKSVAPTLILFGHVGHVTGCCFNSDITKIATCGRDQSVRIWDMANLKKPARVMHACHADWINAIAWSANFIVTASQDFNLKVWDATSGEEKLKLIGHTAAVTDVVYQHGCIVSSCTDGTVKVWSHRGTEITTLHGHTECVTAVDMYVKVKVMKEATPGSKNISWADMMEEDEWLQKHQDAKLSKMEVRLDDLIVASCSEDGSMRLWQPLEGKELACLSGHADRVTAVACARNGAILTASRDKTVRLWQPDLEEGGSDHRVSAPGHGAEVACLLAVPGTDVVLSGSRDGQVTLWAPCGDDGTPVAQYSIWVSTKCVNCMCVGAVMADGICFLTGCNEGKIKLWKMTQKTHGVAIKFISTLPNQKLGPVTSLISNCTSVRKKGYVIATTWDGAHFLNMTGATILEHMPYADHLLVSCMYHQSVVVGGAEGKLDIIQVKMTDKEPMTLLDTTSLSISGPLDSDKDNWVTAVVPWRTAVWVGDSSGQLSKVEGGSVTQTKVHKGSVQAVAQFDTNLVTSGDDGVVRVWAADVTKPVGQFFMTSPITSLATSCRNNTSLIYCGDVVGNVTVLKWIR